MFENNLREDGEENPLNILKDNLVVEQSEAVYCCYQ